MFITNKKPQTIPPGNSPKRGHIKSCMICFTSIIQLLQSGGTTKRQHIKDTQAPLTKPQTESLKAEYMRSLDDSHLDLGRLHPSPMLAPQCTTLRSRRKERGPAMEHGIVKHGEMPGSPKPFSLGRMIKYPPDWARGSGVLLPAGWARKEPKTDSEVLRP